MQCLVYVSKALVPRASPEAGTILEVSRRNNARDGLTGFLHREEDRFVQYLEGPAGTLAARWERIRLYPRHLAPVVLHTGPMPVRLFPDWQMGYADDTVSRFGDFLEEAARKRDLNEATGIEATVFLRAVAQRIDLGLGACAP